MIRTIFLSFAILVFFISGHSQTRIKMKKEGGVYTVPCLVNGLKLKFIFDTGASEVSISLTEALFMLRNDYLKKEDILGTSKTAIANGDIVDNTRILLREIVIGGIVLKDVEANVIHNAKAPLLLGQSAIRKMGKIQMNGDELVVFRDHILLSGKRIGFDNKPQSLRLPEDHGSDSLLTALQKGYQNLRLEYEALYRDSLDVMKAKDFYGMGKVYCKLGDYEKAIVFLNKSRNTPEKMINFDRDLLLAALYRETNEPDSALTICIEITKRENTDEENIQLCLEIAELFATQGQNRNALTFCFEAVAVYRKMYNLPEPDSSQDNTNEFLGYVFLRIGLLYFEENDDEMSNYYLMLATIYGNEMAKQMCILSGLDWNSLWKK